MGRRGGDVYFQTYTPGGQPHKQDSYNLQRLSPGSERSELHTGLPITVVLYQEDKSECLTSSQKLSFRRRQRAVKKIPLLKGTHQISPALGPRGRSSDLKGARSEPLH